jgi:5'-nucleotidase
MSWKLFLDKARFPMDGSWTIARSADEAMALIVQNGYPDALSLDDDLGESENTGLDFLKNLTDSVLRDWPNVSFPQAELDCHSINMDGRCRILGLWKSFQNKLGRLESPHNMNSQLSTAQTEIAPACTQEETTLRNNGDAGNSVAHLVVAISSRALFNLDESHSVFKSDGVEAYCRFQIEREEIPLDPGVAFNLVKKLLALNERDPVNPCVEVILLSRNNADTGLRIFNSIKHHGLNISRAAFTRGESTHPYISAFGAQLFLSAEPNDVRKALEAGFAAATILPSASIMSTDPKNPSQLRIAFDGDAVLFSDESERIFKQEGLDAFESNEVKEALQPLPGGPFKNFLAMLHRIQLDYPADTSPIRTALITARGAPAHERVIRTLRAWKIRIDEAFFLGGKDKGEFLKAFGADIYFDDQQKHCESARHHVATGHVPHGVANE